MLAEELLDRIIGLGGLHNALQHFGGVQCPIFIQVELVDDLKCHHLDGRILINESWVIWICVDVDAKNSNGTLTTFNLDSIG